jgi:integrase
MIVILLCLLGLRIGELLSLRLRDIKTRGMTATLDVRRRPPDPNDNRFVIPVPKTLDRRLPLCPDAARACHAYMLNDRLSTTAGRKSDYVALSRQGRPLTERAAQNVLQQLRLKHPEFSGLCPHVLRNTNEDLVQEALQGTDLNEHQVRDVQTYAGGWVPTSKQPSRYSRAWRERTAEKISLSLQSSIFETLK